MRILYDFAIAPHRAATLVVLLPGALQQPEDFVQFGFIDIVRRSRVPVDLAFADLGLRYISEATDGSVLPRIHEEIVQPAKLQGYRQIWLGGISIGGFIAIDYASAYPGQVDGLSLLAPYPGNRMLINDIRAEGGIDLWQPDSVRDDDECRIWRWFKEQRMRKTLPLYLGYGSEDRFADGLQLIRTTLAPDFVDTVPGGHEWTVWQKLWGHFVYRVLSSSTSADEQMIDKNKNDA
jgi:pimeloyl-ACP methyl ester carboxylesterase